MTRFPDGWPDGDDGYSNRAIAGMVEDFGLEPLIRQFIAADSIADHELRKWWSAAEHALEQITRILDSHER